MSTKTQSVQLPEWVHKIKIRFYKDIYPNEDDMVVAKVRHFDEKIGYYMDLLEYENKEALVTFKEVARSPKLKIILNTFSNEVLYPFIVIDKIITRDNSNDTELNNDIAIIKRTDEDEDYDLTDKSVVVKLYLSFKQPTEDAKKMTMNNFTKYKQVHTLLHNYGFLLKQSQLTSQEDANNIDLENYLIFLEKLANDTIWKYPKDKIFDIVSEIRNDLSKIDTYFELDDFHKEHFKNAICRSIQKTKYIGTCHIKMQTLEIEGIKILQEALELISKTGIVVQVISAPEYCMKFETTDIEKITTRFSTILKQIETFMSQHLGFIQIVNCVITNNISDEKLNIQL